jgi:hypothetical protein
MKLLVDGLDLQQLGQVLRKLTTTFIRLKRFLGFVEQKLMRGQEELRA